MPALSYKGRFVDFVEEGLKPNPKGKYPIKKGDTLYHFYGMRTKFCRRLGQSVCTDSAKIKITASGFSINNKPLIKNTKHLDAFAYSDGFTSWNEMIRWWRLTHGEKCFPFIGQLVTW